MDEKIEIVLDDIVREFLSHGIPLDSEKFKEMVTIEIAIQIEQVIKDKLRTIIAEEIDKHKIRERISDYIDKNSGCYIEEIGTNILDNLTGF